MSASDKSSRPPPRIRVESISPEVVLADAAGVGAGAGKESEAKKIVLVSPALKDANNGNWHTANRWAGFLSGHCDIALTKQWPAPSASPTLIADEPALMLALHARRSAASIQAWASRWPDKPLIVVLTGTDLYRDIQNDVDAQRSLALATHLVVLQDAGLAEVPAAWRSKTQVIYQSASRLVPAVKPVRRFQTLMVGHLRQEKDPLTFMRAARQTSRRDVQFVQIGDALESSLAEASRAAQQELPRYRWLPGMSRADARQHIKRAHVLVNCSVMEGGAQVIVEAIQSGTPVLASRISGNVGMLGAAYTGYFEPGNDTQLANLIVRCAAEPSFLASLQEQCHKRAPLFDPAHEESTVINLVIGAINMAQQRQRTRIESSQ